MRIVSGNLRGRNFKAPSGHRTHPMGDKVRTALFDVLGDIKHLSLLDAFSGSGAIAFEAASRGARFVVAIDRDKQAYKIIQENIESLGLGEQVSIVHGNAVSWSNAHRDQKFSLVVLDPPYDEVLYTSLIKLTRHVAEKGTLVVSLPADEENFLPPGFQQVAQKVYGDAQLVFYRRIS